MGIATKTNNLLQTGMDSAWTALPGFMQGIGLLFGAAIGLYFVMVMLGYIWTGEASKLPIMDLFKRFFFLIIACTFALNADFYVKTVKEPVLAIPDQVGQLVSGSDMNNNSIIDSMVEKNSKLIEDAWKPVKKMGFTSLDFSIIGQAIAIYIVVGLLGTLFVVIAAAYLLIAKLMINVVLMLGPAFIMFGFFPPTREYLMKWVGVVLNYVFLVAIYAATFTLLHNVITKLDKNTLVGHLPPADQMFALIMLLAFIYLLFIGVMMAVPTLASSLTGGVGISPFGQMSQLAGALKRFVPKPKMPKMPKPNNSMSGGKGKTG